MSEGARAARQRAALGWEEEIGSEEPIEEPIEERDEANAEATDEAEATDDREGDDEGYDDGPTWDEYDAVAGERDEYLAMARAKQAELENYKKLVTRRQADHREQAAADLVVKLLPVLDALDQGVAHGDESLVPVRAQLMSVLEKEGLARVEGEGVAFDPNHHQAVAHEPGDGREPVVAETLRSGYRWNGRLVQAAMVKVRG